jgi:transketolase
MTIVAPADADEMRRLMPQTVDYPGPIYIRLGKGYDPIVTNDSIPFKIGKALPMRPGKDVLLVTTGITLKLAQEAAESLASSGISAAILHMPTIKPLDAEAFFDHARAVRAIITIEENTILGGLGGAIAELVAEANFDPAKRFKRIGLPDVFPDKYGSQAKLMEHYRISASEIVAIATQLCGK